MAVPLCGLIAPLLVAALWIPTAPAASGAMRSTTPSDGPLSSLKIPKTTVTQDAKYITDVTEADPAMVAYEKKEGNVALHALLTDGSAFCALLQRRGGFDQAVIDEAVGAQSVESKTSLPMSAATFNAIESVALLTLCPREMPRVPSSIRARIRRLGRQLASVSG